MLEDAIELYTVIMALGCGGLDQGMVNLEPGEPGLGEANQHKHTEQPGPLSPSAREEGACRRPEGLELPVDSFAKVHKPRLNFG